MLCAFTIGTLVTDWEQYRRMKASFIDGGFAEDDCEFIYVDNSKGNTADAYQGLNDILNRARGGLVILCHQDVTLIDDKRAHLEARLGELTSLAPRWAVAGNAGGIARGKLAIRISDPHGADQRVNGPFPVRVLSLDENFIVVRPETRVSFSSDLTGFHMYGADICMVADVLGYTAHVIDFHLHHHSGGTASAAFDICLAAFDAKWHRTLRPRYMQTTTAQLVLSANPFWHAANAVRSVGERFIRRVKNLAR